MATCQGASKLQARSAGLVAGGRTATVLGKDACHGSIALAAKGAPHQHAAEPCPGLPAALSKAAGARTCKAVQRHQIILSPCRHVSSIRAPSAAVQAAIVALGWGFGGSKGGGGGGELVSRSIGEGNEQRSLSALSQSRYFAENRRG